MSASAAKSAVIAATRPRRCWHWALALPLGWMLLVVFLAITADWIGLLDPSAQELIMRRKPPSAEFLLGTDNLGRDMLSRVIYGARTSLIVGICAPFLGFLIGGAIGMSAGYFRGKVDLAGSRLHRHPAGVPSLVLALTFTAYSGRSLFDVTLALGILSIPAAAWVSRAVTLAWANRDFLCWPPAPSAPATGAS